MIVKSIEKHKEPVWNPLSSNNNWPYPINQNTNHRHQPNMVTRYEMDKQQYAAYITEKGFQKGDLVALKGAPRPLTLYNVWRITDIEEIHHLVKDWGTGHTGPYVMTFEDFRGTIRGYKGAPGLYARIEDLEELPQDWKDTLNADKTDN